MCTKLFLVEMKAQWDKGDGKILLGGNTAGGVVVLWPIWFQCIGVWILTGLTCICIYSWPYVYWVLTCPNLTCAGTSST